MDKTEKVMNKVSALIIIVSVAVIFGILAGIHMSPRQVVDTGELDIVTYDEEAVIAACKKAGVDLSEDEIYTITQVSMGYEESPFIVIAMRAEGAKEESVEETIRNLNETSVNMALANEIEDFYLADAR